MWPSPKTTVVRQRMLSLELNNCCWKIVDVMGERNQGVNLIHLEKCLSEHEGDDEGE